MNEKDKAIDLVDKYLERLTLGERFLDDMYRDEAKEYAIIAIDEIINEAKRWNSSYMGNKRYCELLKVKEEILKL